VVRFLLSLASARSHSYRFEIDFRMIVCFVSKPGRSTMSASGEASTTEFWIMHEMTRRSLITRTSFLVASLGALGPLSLISRASRAQTGRAVKKTLEFGGGGGDEFPMEYPTSIGFRTAAEVDAVDLNGVRHGGGGGGPTPVLTLDQDDYWSEFEVHSGGRVDYVRFRSKQGQEISGGGGGGEKREVVKGVRLLRVGGRSAGRLDQIRLEYIENYRPSQKVDANATAVLDFSPGGEMITTYQDKSLATAEAYERITESMREFSVNTSAEGEYYAKFSVSTGFKTTDSTKETMKSSVEQSLKTGRKSERTVGPNQVAILLSSVTVMKDSDGRPWMYPNASPNWVIIEVDQAKARLVNCYDLTSGMATQIGIRTQIKNGYRMLVAN
jgi:hypothetical protein